MATSEIQARTGDGQAMPTRGRHPVHGELSDVVRGLVVHARLPWLLQHHDRRPVLAAFSFVAGVVSIAILAAVAAVTGSPFVFPSLGPTAFLFFYTPTAPPASPHNTIIGHAIGVAAGYLSLVVTGLTQAPPALASGVTGPRVVAASLSLGLTAAAMVLCNAAHPPAGATTLIISLGIMARPGQLVVLMIAVVLLTAVAFAINRAAGIDYPLWRPRRGDREASATASSRADGGDGRRMPLVIDGGDGTAA